MAVGHVEHPFPLRVHLQLVQTLRAILVKPTCLFPRMGMCTCDKQILFLKAPPPKTILIFAQMFYYTGKVRHSVTSVSGFFDIHLIEF